jgi:hypothetical protein
MNENRRDFLRNSVVLTALSTSRILGANERVRIAGLGTGGRCSYLLSLASKAGAEIVALCDVYEPRRLAGQEKLAPAARADYVVGEDEIDALGWKFGQCGEAVGVDDGVAGNHDWLLFVLETAPCGLLYGSPAGGQSSGATGNFGYARGMHEGQGKILIAPGAPPASCRERKAKGVSCRFGKERDVSQLRRISRNATSSPSLRR